MKKALVLLLFVISSLFCAPVSEKAAVIDYDQLVEDLRVISSDEMKGRRTGTEGNDKARVYIIERFKEVGAQPYIENFIYDFDFTSRGGEEMSGKNILAVVKGISDSTIVISAHYDHLGERDSLIFNGADDDASGTAALIALADYFGQSQPNKTLVFAAFDAEEMGLQGARAFVADSSLMQNVYMNINLDMISNNNKDELYAVGTYHYPDLKAVLESVETGSIKMMFGHDSPDLGSDDWTNSSDHAPFHAQGIPFVYFGVEDHEHYHKASDEFSTIPLDFYKGSVRAILNAIRAFDEQ